MITNRTACVLLFTSLATCLVLATNITRTEPLIPEIVVQGLLKTYSEKEKNLINNDLNNIKQICFQDKEPSTETERVYIATAGGPGACKSTILENYIQDKSNLVYADPDPRSLKFMTNTYYQSLTYYDISKNASYQDQLKSAYDKWRDASNYIANTILNDAYAGGYNIAHGTTLTGPVIAQLLSKLQQKNYKITLLLCYAQDEARIKALDHRSNVQAFVQSSPEDAINKGKVFHQRFPTYFQYADEIHFYWTDDFAKGSTCSASYKKNAGLTVHNQQAFNSFTQKYDADRKGSAIPSLDELVQSSKIS